MFSSKKLIAILFALLVVLVPVMNAVLLTPTLSPPSGLPFAGPPDFTISASASTLTIAAGSSGTSGITLASVGGFSGLILLSTSGFLLDASLDKENVTLSSGGTGSTTLTVVVPISTTPGNYTATVNGVNGCSLLHSTDIVVIVTGPDFTISSSKPVLSTTPGGFDSTLITMTSVNGFSGLVSVFAFGSGVSTFLSPSSVPVPIGGSGSSNLTISAPPSTLPGNYTVEVVASSGSLARFLDLLVTVIGPGFTASASPFFLEVTVGGSNSSTILLKPFGGFTGVVSLSNSSSPPGLEATFAPPTLSLPGPGTSTLTVFAPPGTSLGFYDLTVTAFNPTFNATLDVPVLVKGPDFSISASPSEISLVAGGSSCSSTVTITALNGFTGSITLFNSTFPSGLNVSISTSVITTAGTATLTIFAPANTVPGFYFIEVDANSTSITHFTSVVVNVTGPDFSLSTSPSSLSITAPLTGNTSKNSTVTVKSLHGFTGNVSLVAFIAGFNMTAIIAPVNVTSPGTAILTVSVGNDSISGVYTAVIIGTSGPLTHFGFVSVTVIAPDFSLSASPSTVSIDTFTPGTSSITSTPLNGFAGSVDLFVYAPPEVNASITPSTIPASGTATLSVNSTVPGTYTVEIDGFSGFLVHSTFVSVTVVGPDFSIASSPSTLTVPAGSNANSTVSVTGLNGFTGSVNVTGTAPFGLTATLNVSNITPTTTAKLTVTVAPDTPAGTYYVDVVGASSLLTHTAIVTVQVTDFTISASPSSLTIPVGTNKTSTITMDSVNGFSGTVSLSASAPSGLTPFLNTTSVAGSGHAQLTVLASSSITPGTYLVNVTGTLGSLTHTTTVTVIIPVPNFSISATSPVTVLVGGTGNSTIIVSPIAGLTEDVTLAVSSSPAGLSCSLSSTTVTGASGTSTLSCSGSTGTYTVTVTGTSSSAGPHTATVTVSVTDFTISAGPVSPSQNLPSVSGSSTITLTGLNGFTGTVGLSVSTSTPSGLTCSLPSTALFGTSPQTKTLSCSASAAENYTVTVTGTIGSLSHVTASILFHVTDFTATSSPTSVAVIAGASASSTITVAPVNGFTGTVALTSTVSPAGLTCTLTPSSIVLGASQTSTLSCSGPAGAYTVTITGTSGSLTHTATVTYTVTDYTVAASPTSVSALAGATATSTISVTPVNGFTGTVALTSTASPTGLTCTLSPTSVVLGVAQTSTLSCSGPAGAYTVTVTGTSGSLSHSATVTVTVTDFTVTASPTSVTALASAAAASTITVAPVNGFTGTVALASTVSPAGLTCTLTPASIVLGASQTSALSCTGSAGVYTVTITGTSGSLSLPATVTVTIQDFTVTAAPTSVNVNAGTAAISTITVAPQNGFTGTVALTSAVSPAGLTCTLTPSSIILGASQTSALSCSGSTGVYTAIVTGTSGSRALTATVTVTIGDFSVIASPTSESVATGSSATSTITVGFLNGLTVTVSLTESTSPSTGITCSLTSSSFTSSGTSTLSCIPSATGTFTVTLTGSSGSLSHTTTFTITSSVPNFTITANPTTLTIQAGSSGTSTITIAPVNGFTGTVTLTPTVPNAGLSTAFSVSNVAGGSGSSTLTITVDSNTAPATYTVTVQGVSGSLAHNALVNVTVAGTGSSTGSNILGLPSTTFYGIIIVIVIAAVGAALYFTRFRKKAA